VPEKPIAGFIALEGTYTASMRRFFLRMGKFGSLQRSLLIAVAVALIGTQTIGVQHRVEHGTATGWIADDHHTAIEPEGDSHDSDTHSCAAVDALALGDGPPAPALSLAACAPAATPLADRSQRAPETSALRSFHARAPPASLS
jgi:hypothetical protein